MTARFAAMSRDVWSTTSTVLVTEPSQLRAARTLLDGVIDDVELAASRFRPDSELEQVNRSAGQEQMVSPLLGALIGTALDVAEATGGAVDPTVAVAVIDLGYDRDIALLTSTRRDVMRRAIGDPGAVVAGHRVVRFDRGTRRLLVPAGTWLDLGASAKAWTADRAAERIETSLGCGVLVNLGGDISARGPAPVGGWHVGIGDHHRTAAHRPADGPVVSIASGGLATSSTMSRRFVTPLGVRHHIVDPRTGENPPPRWRTVTAVAPTAVGANAASTAAIVLADDARKWLCDKRIPARLVGESGDLEYVAGWPIDRAAVA